MNSVIIGNEYQFDLSLYGIDKVQANEYLVRLRCHIDCVHKACEMVNVSREQASLHDLSKFSIHEFPYYVRHWHGDKGDPQGYAKAWLHHMNHNPHHWNYWLFPDGFDMDGANIVDGAVAMPEIYIREMVADWLGAEMAYNGSWYMKDWLLKNLGKIKLHPETRQKLNAILANLEHSGLTMEELEAIGM